MCIVYKDIYVYICVCAPRVRLRCSLSVHNEQIFPYEREFFFLNEKRQFFARKKKNVNNNTENNFVAKGSPVGGEALLHARW